MRKTVLALVAVFVALAMLAPPALAQAPAPKVTISGLVDNVTSWSRNMSIEDLNYDRSGDREWYARTRVRPDLTAEVGTTKFVLGLEMDATWGQTTGNRFATRESWDLNTDEAGFIEIKWAYTDFAVPFLPAGSRMRIGAQPFGRLCTYKLAAYCNGDFAGAVLTLALTPMVKLNGGYVQVEEELTGTRDGFTVGEDQAFILSADISPFKGLDIKPLYSYANFEGATSGSARAARGGVAVGVLPTGADESRHTIGADMRWQVGPVSIEPTLLFQFGQRDVDAAAGATVPGDQDMRAIFLDVRAGFQAGPMLIEGAAIYTTGNKSDEDVRDSGEDVNFYQPLDTDSSFYGGWANIFALGIDYFNILYATAGGLNPGNAIGYDKYGLMRLGARARYAFTPAFSLNAGAHFSWTAEEVDTDSTLAAASGLTPSATAGGDDRFLGTELDLGFTWRFAPNVAFDMVGAYLFAGDALAHAASPDPSDVQTLVARVRYTF